MSPRTPPGQTRGRVLDFMRQRLLDGDPPTVREVQEAFGFRAVQTAREHLETLVSEGSLAKVKEGRSRGYRLPPGEAVVSSVRIPILGRVQAGALTTALEEPEGFLDVPALFSSGSERFALRVRGDSMIDAGILEGDLVVVRRQSTADPGEMVVAMVGDEATVKVLKTRRGRVELHPANEAYSPIVPPPDELSILGKVIEVRRYLEGGGPLAPSTPVTTSGSTRKGSARGRRSASDRSSS